MAKYFQLFFVAFLSCFNFQKCVASVQLNQIIYNIWVDVIESNRTNDTRRTTQVHFNAVYLHTRMHTHKYGIHKMERVCIAHTRTHYTKCIWKADFIWNESANSNLLNGLICFHYITFAWKHGIILNVIANANENYVFFAHVCFFGFWSSSLCLSPSLSLSLYSSVYSDICDFSIVNKWRPWALFFEWSSWFQSGVKIKVCHFSMETFHVVFGFISIGVAITAAASAI